MIDYSNKKCSVKNGEKTLWGNSYTTEWKDVPYGALILIGDNPSLYTVERYDKKTAEGEFELITTRDISGRLVQDLIFKGNIVLDEGDEVVIEYNGHSIHRVVVQLVRKVGKIYAKSHAPLRIDGNEGETSPSVNGTFKVEKNSLELKEAFIGSNLTSASYLIIPAATKNLNLPIIEFQNNKLRALYAALVLKLDDLAGELVKEKCSIAQERAEFAEKLQYLESRLAVLENGNKQ